LYVCCADHHNDPLVLGRWLANKTPKLVASWTRNPGNSVLLVTACTKDGQAFGPRIRRLSALTKARPASLVRHQAFDGKEG
jgi:hypothetical protein